MLKEALQYLVGTVGEPKVLDHPTEPGAKIMALPPGWSSSRVADDVRLRRLHAFAGLESLLAWLRVLPKTEASASGKPSAIEVLLDPDEDKIAVTVDPRDRYSDAFTATLPTASEYDMVNEALGQAMTHREFYLLLQQVKHVLEGADVILTQAATLSATSDAGIEARINAHGNYSIVNQTNKTDVCSQLPSVLHVTVPIFAGVYDPDFREVGSEVPSPLTKMRTYTLELQLTINTTKPTAPSFTLSCPRLEEVLTEAREDVLTVVRHVLDESNVAYLAGFGTARIAEVKLGA